MQLQNMVNTCSFLGLACIVKEGVRVQNQGEPLKKMSVNSSNYKKVS